jgi:hypothetical protein
LFLVAHIAGVAPVMVDHAAHVFEGQPAVAKAHDYSASTRHIGHRHGIGYVKDECCALHHHLTGIIPFMAPAVAVKLAMVPLAAPRVRLLASSDPTLLERPPKALSLI